MTPPTTSDDPNAGKRSLGLQYGEHGQCTATAKSAGRRCQRPATGAHRKCRFHGGASTGPTDSSALEGNDHAAGNSGGGAPPGNTNAEKSGAWSDWEKVYDRAEGEAREYIDLLERETLDEACEHALDVDPDRRARLVKEYATLFLLWRRASNDTAVRGMVLEETYDLPEGRTVAVPKANPTLRRGCDISSRQRMIAKELRLYPGFQD
jgi:hypothetical protein